MMMKHAQTILVKYCRKGITSIASSPMSSRVKHAWEEQDGLVLGLAFIGGWFAKASINLYKRREDWYRIHRFIDHEEKRFEEARALTEKEVEDLKKLFLKKTKKLKESKKLGV